MKVSFGFDNMLSSEIASEFAKELVEQGHEVWVVTRRNENNIHNTKEHNTWLFEIAEEIGIKKEHIHFCNMCDKFHFFKDKDFLFHLDNNNNDLELIRTETNVFPIYQRSGNDWENQCKDLIRILSKQNGKI